MESRFRFLAAALAGLSLCACSTEAKTEAQGETVLDTQFGEATFYANSFQGGKTASGTKFDNRKATAAHRNYPFGTVVRVTNLENGRSTNVVILDRGPYGKNHREGAIIDLSRDAARALDVIENGKARVKLEVLSWGS
ncbi:MAG TPA: septal ring lytic transglycosylase RlpA family protein [Terriglobia bacterium]|jgi:rare lipoprotein A